VQLAGRKSRSKIDPGRIDTIGIGAVAMLDVSRGAGCAEGLVWANATPSGAARKLSAIASAAASFA